MDYNEAINSAKTVIVEFYASWCPHCQRMMPIVAQIKQLLTGKAEVFQYDIDENGALADKEKVETIPTFIIYNDGKEVWRHSGEMSEDNLMDSIKNFL